MTALPSKSNSDGNGEVGQSDAFLDEIQSINRSIAQRFDHDVRKLGEHLIQNQEANRDRLVFRKLPDRL